MLWSSLMCCLKLRPICSKSSRSMSQMKQVLASVNARGLGLGVCQGTDLQQAAVLVLMWQLVLFVGSKAATLYSRP